jgi:cell division protein FtsW
MTSFARDDTSLLGRWWWTVDRWSLAALIALASLGAILILAASPAVAIRLDLDAFALVRRHFALLPLALTIMVGVSLLGPRAIRRLAAIGFVVALAATVLTLFTGIEVKGATRWLSLAGFSLQPSEFLKPTFAVVAAWLLASPRETRGPSTAITLVLAALVIMVLLRQPDLGMSAVIAATWLLQVFLAGMPLPWVVLAVTGASASMVGSYFVFPHVAERVNAFIDPSSTDTYQIDRSLEAFVNGGLIGRGPGEGTVKLLLPDAHADFVFAVAGEEFGLVACLGLVGLFAFIVLRGMTRLLAEGNAFVQMAGTGLLATFGLQALVNMGSALRLIPTKGMTLPFVSYGGSSLLATALGMGMLLALSRRRPGAKGLA